VQAASITPNSPAGTRFQFTGFVKADANFTDMLTTKYSF